MKITIPSRIIEINSEQVILECLVLEKPNTYEERIFNPSLFSPTLKIGELFAIEITTKLHETKIKFIPDPNKSLQHYFPQVNLAEQFKTIQFSKKLK
jgi:hypothetical protein